jgi:hypothetical protein
MQPNEITLKMLAMDLAQSVHDMIEYDLERYHDDDVYSDSFESEIDSEAFTECAYIAKVRCTYYVREYEIEADYYNPPSCTLHVQTQLQVLSMRALNDDEPEVSAYLSSLPLAELSALVNSQLHFN